MKKTTPSSGATNVTSDDQHPQKTNPASAANTAAKARNQAKAGFGRIYAILPSAMIVNTIMKMATVSTTPSAMT